MDTIQAALQDPANRDLTLGLVLEKLDNLQKSNDAEHSRIFKRLEEGDQYFAVFKLSRCAFSWLDRQGAVKWALMAIIFFCADWASRYLYWGVFTKP